MDSQSLSQNNLVLDDYSCVYDQLTTELMTDHYITKYGHTFEKNTILKWINGNGNGKCPITKQPLNERDIFPNRAIKDILDKINSQKIILPQKLERKVVEFD